MIVMTVTVAMSKAIEKLDWITIEKTTTTKEGDDEKKKKKKQYYYYYYL